MTKREMLLLLIGSIALIPGLGARAQSAPAPTSTPYVVLSKTQVMVEVNCIPGCPSANLTNNTLGQITPGSAQPLLSGDSSRPAPSHYWTLVTFPAPFQFVSKGNYLLVITHAGTPATPMAPATPVKVDPPVSIDTSPTVKISQGAGKGSANLTSNVAISLPKSASPLFNIPGQATCATGAVQSPTASLQLPNLSFDFSGTRLCQVAPADLNTGYVSEPFAVSVIQGVFSTRQTVKSNTSIKSTVQINGLSNVLGDALQIDASSTIAKQKACTTEAACWLWINGTLTAGTGTAPAWVLGAKLATPPQQLPAQQQITWASATADIGNNKINGQAARDVIDFSGFTWNKFHDGTAIGEEFSAAPTYETNRELNHKNMLAVVDVLWDWGKLNQTQFVRTARTHDAAKMPKDGDYNNPNPKMRAAQLGWNLHFHTGFETGGALEAVTITNSKTKATVGTIPTYPIARAVPQVDGILQYRSFSFESDLIARYLFTTEHTSVTDNAGNPYLETVTGWKAVNVGTFSFKPDDQHYAFTIGYTNGFAAPTYQRVNGIKIGLQVSY
jgi:hypothetical protein